MTRICISMMNRTLIWLILLLLVMIGVEFWDYSGVESSSIVGDKLTPSTPNGSRAANNILNSYPTRQAKARMKFLPSEDRSHLWDRAHSPILKDLTLGFSSLQKMQSFLDNAPMNGIKIKGRSDALLTVRFAVKDLPTASRFLTMLRTKLSHSSIIDFEPLPCLEQNTWKGRRVLVQEQMCG